MSRRDWRGFLVIAVAAIGISSSASAEEAAAKQPLANAFTVEPARCLTRESLAPAVARWLGHDEIDARIAISVKREGDAVVYGLYRGGILVGRRKVTSLPIACSEFTTALALALAVAIEATFFGAENPTEGEAPVAPAREERPVVPAPVSAPGPGPNPTPRRPSSTAQAARRRATLFGEAGVLWNTLPGVRPLFGVGIDVAWSRVFETRTSILTAISAASPLGEGKVETRLYAVRADACAGLPVGPARVRSCAGVAWGFVEAQGIDFIESRSPAQPWLGLPVRVEARLPITRDRAWGVLATTELIVSLRRPQLGVAARRGGPQSRDEPHTAILVLAPLGIAAVAGPFFEF